MNIAKVSISDFKRMCDKCDKSDENHHFRSCEYWMHQHEFYGNSILCRSYCSKCINIFDLYDGRTEAVCEKCVKYVRVFIVHRKFLKALTIIHERFDGKIREFCECYHNEDDVPDSVNRFIDILVNFDKKDLHEISINTLDMDNIIEWLYETT